MKDLKLIIIIIIQKSVYLDKGNAEKIENADLPRLRSLVASNRGGVLQSMLRFAKRHNFTKTK
jgi:hypothetical protein